MGTSGGNGADLIQSGLLLNEHAGTLFIVDLHRIVSFIYGRKCR